MRNLILVIPIILFLTSCGATDGQKKRALQNATFDTTIITSISYYEKFKIFLIENSEAIIRHSDSLYIAKSTPLGKERLKKTSKYPDSYIFREDYKTKEIEDLPNHLKRKINDMYHSLGKNTMNCFIVYRDNNIHLVVKASNVGNALYIGHYLIWDKKITKDQFYVAHKDTLLNNNCIYRIWLEERHFQ